MTTDTSEKGLEALIVRAMTGRTDVLSPAHSATETSVPVAGGTGWLLGDAEHYDREYAVDLVQLRGFLLATQEPLVEALSLATDGPTRRKFVARLQGEISRRGPIDVLRKGLDDGPRHVDLFCGTPSAGQYEGPGAVRLQPFQRHAAAPIQPRRNPTRARPVPLHQRAADRHLRAEEQPHEADRRGR